MKTGGSRPDSAPPTPARCVRQWSADDAAAAFIASIWPVIGGAGHEVTGRAARREGQAPAWP